MNVSNTQFLIGFGLAAIIGGAVWVHADRHGSKHPTAWAMCIVFFLGIALPVYLIHYHRTRRAR